MNSWIPKEWMDTATGPLYNEELEKNSCVGLKNSSRRERYEFHCGDTGHEDYKE